MTKTKENPVVLGWARGIDRRRFGDETGVWHLVIEEPGEFPRAGASCGKAISGQIEPLDGNVCQRCETKARRCGPKETT